MYYFDCNCWLGRPEIPMIRTFSIADDLLEVMDRYGIERAMVSHFGAQRSFVNGNSELMRQLKGHKDRLFPCWVINPRRVLWDFTFDEIFKILVDNNVKMVRLQIESDNQRGLHSWVFAELFDRFSEHKIVLRVDVTMGRGYVHTPVPEYEWQNIYEVAQRWSELPMILFSTKLSVSIPQVLGILQSCSNVRLDISAFQYWRMTEILCERVGADKLVFGSFMPFFDAGQFAVQIAYANVSEIEKRKIAHLNMEELVSQ